MTRLPQVGDYGVQPLNRLTLRALAGPDRWQLLIALGTFSRYWHAAVVIAAPGRPPGVPEGAPERVEIVEAAQGGARRRWCNSDEFVWSRCPLTPNQRHLIRAEALTCVGLPYDFRDIAGFVVRFLGAKIRGRSADHADRRLICSELVAWCYRVAGHEVAPSREVAPGDVSPGDLADHITRE